MLRSDYFPIPYKTMTKGEKNHMQKVTLPKNPLDFIWNTHYIHRIPLVPIV